MSAEMFSARWEQGAYTTALSSRFVQIAFGRLCLTAQWDLLSRHEWEIWVTVGWGKAMPSWRKEYVRIYLGPGTIPF
jgi:hypothetical protein